MQSICGNHAEQWICLHYLSPFCLGEAGCVHVFWLPVLCLSFRPNYPTETTEEESVIEDDAELTLRKVEEEMIVGAPTLFNCIRSSPRPKCLLNLVWGYVRAVQVNTSLLSWITGFLTSRPQFVRLRNSVSGPVMSNTGALQGTALSPFLFTLYTWLQLQLSHATCKSSQVTLPLWGVSVDSRRRRNTEARWRTLLGGGDWTTCSWSLARRKELIVDFSRTRPPLTPVSIQGEDVEVVHSYKYLGVHLDDRLEWTGNARPLYKKGQSWLYFLQRLRGFNDCNKMLPMLSLWWPYFTQCEGESC